MTKERPSTKELLKTILEVLDESKALDIKTLDLTELENTVFDYFVVCSGSSNIHLKSISGKVQKDVSKILKEKPLSVEGEDYAQWILLDFVNIVVHIFQKQTREHFDIESLWGDAKVTTYNS